MNFNDAKITRLFVGETGSHVQDDAPNAATPPSLTFDVTVEMAAGSGAAGGYELFVTACDITRSALAPPSMIPPFSGPGNFGTAPWQAVNTDAVYNATATLPVPQNAHGHVFQYTAALVSNNGQIVSITETDSFILL